jgi:hypothetical protein
LRRLRPLRLSFTLAGVFALALLLLVGPFSYLAAGSHPSGTPDRTSDLRPDDATFSATVTFQGAPTTDYSTPGSAIRTSFDSSFTSVFNWSSDQATLVTQATLSVLFLGATVGTTSNTLNNAVPSLIGNITLTSDFTQNKFLFEGVYQLIASLYDHGQAIYNTTFYVWVQAPYHLTVVNVALLLIGAYEVWQIAALGSARVARKQLGLDPPPEKEAP